MLFADGFLAIAELVLLVYCVLDVISTPSESVRNLPKLLWLGLVIVLPLVGGIAWLVAGRPQGRVAGGTADKRNRGVPAAYDRPGRAVASSPDDDEAFLRQLRERADAQRAEAEQARERERAREEQERQDAWRRRHGGSSD